jgi:hypothetical protein
MPSAKAIAAASDVSRKALLVESLKSSIIRANMDASIQKISLPNEMNGASVPPFDQALAKSIFPCRSSQ